MDIHRFWNHPERSASGQKPAIATSTHSVTTNEMDSSFLISKKSEKKCSLPASGHPELNQVFFLRHLALAEAQRQHYGDALNILGHLIECSPNKAEDYSNRGLIYFRSGQLANALKDYNTALSLNPRLDKAYNNRANYYAAQGQLQKAISDYDHAIDLNPYNIRARLNQGITFREMKHYDAAIACFDTALIFGKLKGHLYAERGRTYHLMGDWNCAISDYHSALTYLNRDSLVNNKVCEQLLSQVSRWLEELKSLN